jgi:hypothetical protein
MNLYGGSNPSTTGLRRVCDSYCSSSVVLEKGKNTNMVTVLSISILNGDWLITVT